MNRHGPRFKISNHHGDVNAPNQLEQAKAVHQKYGHEIDIYEVDFVSFHDTIVSAHDYDLDKVALGSTLEEWIAYFVLEQRKVLWLDVKENLAIYVHACGFAQFNCPALFAILEQQRDALQRVDPTLDLVNHIILGCQEDNLHARLKQACGGNPLHQPWHMILDAPTVWSYVLQYVTPECLKPRLRDTICEEFKHSTYREYSVISIDQSFFADREDIVQFIKELKVDTRMMIILNSFPRHYEPIVIPGYYIVMQYDYTMVRDDRGGDDRRPFL